ncbi:tRNA (adenosine(37)-N6)-threonylcarbamoyltransferase complex dimerization subunit type 1 TsaB [Marinobacter halodurans]|uniref:tRNA threonylcarbamoyladenosine biosynthesis protein TsaB n=1 Tax=Marinobacter halodurans TaxID=2528979 RepID=A0ABY1ZQ38_9GAMM|nr:tRNA (adenosine(37)-N6)-threonylcarbamoyltransferase complex dimerization subunit type 1 TsaB [Marinobacter halodurans]TBW57878.1 tRNA (adenosine(37)-N6)-threonylcarbamoyltransferase complex dimerization subunit type 1 TsaB [Marinobacter halodurans]
MKLLALDTTAEGCSAALWTDGTLFERAIRSPRGHTQHLLPMIRELVDESGVPLAALDALAFGRGPGSFTGLRIATGVVQGLAFGLDLPVVPVSSLAAVASRALRTGLAGEGDGIAVAFDARMSEVYWNCYRIHEGRVQSTAQERVCPPDQVVLSGDASRWLGAGSGWHLADRMPEPVRAAMLATHPDWYPLASDIATLAVADWPDGPTVSAEQAAPVYVRDEITWKKLPGR